MSSVFHSQIQGRISEILILRGANLNGGTLGMAAPILSLLGYFPRGGIFLWGGALGWADVADAVGELLRKISVGGILRKRQYRDTDLSLTDDAFVFIGCGVNAILEIEKQIERLPVEDFAELAAWMWERAEDDEMLRACVETVEEGKELASRDEVFALLDRR